MKNNSTDAAVAGMIGFTAGIAIGAAVNNNYYYGPYGWHGGAYMYNDAWDDYYDHREDAREDWQDHREDLAEERSDRREDVAEERGDRQEPGRDERRNQRHAHRAQQQTPRRRTGPNRRPSASSTHQCTDRVDVVDETKGSGSYESRGYTSGPESTATQERSGTRSDAFSGYSSGKSERAASSRGQSSRSSSRSARGGRKRR